MKTWIFIISCVAILIIIVRLNFLNAWDDLDNLAAARTDCIKFQERYNQVNPHRSTESIENKIDHCKDIGAWTVTK